MSGLVLKPRGEDRRRTAATLSETRQGSMDILSNDETAGMPAAIKVSACVATYNGESFIVEQLRSILASAAVDEVIVSDDGSTDGTLERVRALGDPRVRLVTGPHAGLTRNVESMLKQARGAYIFLADQDDVWLATKVQHHVAELERGAMMTVSDCMVVDAQLRELAPSYFALRGSRRGFIRNLLKNHYLGCCMAFRRELLAAALPFPARPPAHDWWLGMVAEMVGTVSFIRLPLLRYRRHGQNQSSASGRSTASIADRLARRAHLLTCLAKRWAALRFR